MMGASQTRPSSIVWSVEVSAEGVYSSSEKFPAPWTDELAGACEASLLQSIEEEQLRLSQVLRSGAGYELS